jgi:hypothetical protein
MSKRIKEKKQEEKVAKIRAKKNVEIVKKIFTNFGVVLNLR